MGATRIERDSDRMSDWKESAAHSMGGSEKKPKQKKVIREIRTRKTKNGAYLHEHHHSSDHPMEEHSSADQAAMLAHMAQAMPGPAAAPAPDAEAAGAPDASAAPAAPAVPGM